MSESIKINGLDGVVSKLQQLGAKVATSYARKSLRAGANVTLKAARAGAPVKSGLLSRNIKVKSAKAGRGAVGVKVSLSGKLKTKSGKTEPYGLFQEEGWHQGKRLLKTTAPYQYVGKDGKVKYSWGSSSAEARANYRAASRKAGRRQFPGKHFMTLAFEATKSVASQVIADTMKQLINSGE